jgi:hypothetical protein
MGKSPSSTPSAPATPTTTITPTLKKKITYLADVQPVSSEFTQGRWRIGNVTYSHSLGIPAEFEGDAVYRLGSRYSVLKAVFIMTESGAPYEDANLYITLDGENTSQRTITARHPANITIDVTGVDELALKVRSDDFGLLKVLAEAQLEN